VSFDATAANKGKAEETSFSAIAFTLRVSYIHIRHPVHTIFTRDKYAQDAVYIFILFTMGLFSWYSLFVSRDGVSVQLFWDHPF
jgi:hypothetical protein